MTEISNAEAGKRTLSKITGLKNRRVIWDRIEKLAPNQARFALKAAYLGHLHYLEIGESIPPIKD